MRSFVKNTFLEISGDIFKFFRTVFGGHGNVDHVKIRFCFKPCFGNSGGDPRAIICGGGARQKKDVVQVFVFAMFFCADFVFSQHKKFPFMCDIAAVLTKTSRFDTIIKNNKRQVIKMFQKIFACVLLIGLLAVLVSCSFNAHVDETTAGESDVTFSEDLTLEALRSLLLEKGDALRFADIPEKYFYTIPVPMVPQLEYPIDENTSFYIMQISANEYSYILTVRSSAEETRDYTGAEDILAYLENK